MEWLEQQPDVNIRHTTTKTSALNLLEMIEINHIVLRSSLLVTVFSVSKISRAVGIASLNVKPSLSVIYPGTDKPPLISPGEDEYATALFITISDQEYLAAGTGDKIVLWNLEKNTLHVAFQFTHRKGCWHLCAIDERTIACSDQSSDGFSEIYILNTDSEKFKLSSTLRIEVGRAVVGICYVKTADGTPCLLMICPLNNVVKCVEMVGGKVRWQLSKEQMGRDHYPWSVCTDGNTVFVPDLAQRRLHLLSVEDGRVITSINMYPFGIYLPVCVRLQGEHLYIGHVNEKGDTYCIAKFIKPTAN